MTKALMEAHLEAIADNINAVRLNGYRVSIMPTGGIQVLDGPVTVAMVLRDPYHDGSGWQPVVAMKEEA